VYEIIVTLLITIN